MNENHVPVSAVVDTDLAGKFAAQARPACVRVICISTGYGGTGFMHHSGMIITAEHVVREADQSSLVVLSADGKQFQVKRLFVDPKFDLAAIEIAGEIDAEPLALSTESQFATGTQVTTWGYPGGYSGIAPLLTVGYLAGVEDIQTEFGHVTRSVVNAAFNGGNSGGPLLRMEDGTVIGVVVAKFAPFPPYIKSAIEALSRQRSGLTMTKTTNGISETVVEGQVVADVLEFLRSQTQLVVGHAVTITDLIFFLNEHWIKPIASHSSERRN